MQVCRLQWAGAGPSHQPRSRGLHAWSGPSGPRAGLARHAPLATTKPNATASGATRARCHGQLLQLTTMQCPVWRAKYDLPPKPLPLPLGFLAGMSIPATESEEEAQKPPLPRPVLFNSWPSSGPQTGVCQHHLHHHDAPLEVWAVRCVLSEGLAGAAGAQSDGLPAAGPSCVPQLSLAQDPYFICRCPCHCCFL